MATPVPLGTFHGRRMTCIASLLLCLVLSANAADHTVDNHASDVAGLPDLRQQIVGKDTLRASRDADPDAQQCLDGLCWNPTTFRIRFETADPDRGSLVVRFPSPVGKQEQPALDVALEWYAATDSSGNVQRAPAIVVVHESGSGMAVGRLLAKGFCAQGVHAFLIHLPGYGRRRGERPQTPEYLLQQLQQGIADTRRARDVVSRLPFVDGSCIGLQGTSLGGFVALSAAALDDGFDKTFIFLAGGKLDSVILEGKRDAAKVRQRLQDAGLDSEGIRQLTRPVEPLRLAHRLNAQSTWLYTGLYDDVVPPHCSDALVEAAGLPAAHHITFPVDHYSGVVFLPAIILDISTRLRGD